mmetsp:Transcript_49735/g.127949  ORF Transcript_49735/g.127949 Transcript_49735/m.127949 type:complete len:159 (-) Transcript_49735:91-567(-)
MDICCTRRLGEALLCSFLVHVGACSLPTQEMLDETDSVIHGAKFLIDGTILRTSKRVLLKTRADVEHTIGQLKQKFKFLDCNKTTGIQVEKMIPLQMLCLRLFAFDQRVQRKSWDRFSRPEFIVVSDNIFGEDLPPPPNLEKEVRANTVVEEQRRCDC